MMTATTLNTTGSNPTSTPSPLLWSTQFPETVLRTHVLGYLSLHERCSLFGMNRHLFFTIKPNYEQSQTHLVLRTATEAQLLHALKPPGLSYSWLTLSLIHNLSWKLHTLDLGPYCSDAFLQRFSLMQQTAVLPKVQHLAMARSVEVTDHGLAALSQHPTLQLVSLDITFCSNTTYQGTLCVRDRYHATLQVLRRQPVWLDGQFQTPFRRDTRTWTQQHHQLPASTRTVREEEEADLYEQHTYYPDGTFSFTRPTQSRGFVTQVVEWTPTTVEGRNAKDPDKTKKKATPLRGHAPPLPCVVNKIQFTNFEPYVGWPDWTTFSYRPGVVLFPVPPPEDENIPHRRSVLVGQNMRSVRPSTRIIYTLVTTHLQQLQALDLGTSTYFSRQIRPVEEEVRSRASTATSNTTFITTPSGSTPLASTVVSLQYVRSATVPSIVSDDEDIIMISRMQVCPLPPTPPKPLPLKSKPKSVRPTGTRAVDTSTLEAEASEANTTDTTDDIENNEEEEKGRTTIIPAAATTTSSDGGTKPTNTQTNTTRHSMVLLPPEDLVRECRRACARMQEIGDEELDQYEEQLNRLLDS